MDLCEGISLDSHGVFLVRDMHVEGPCNSTFLSSGTSNVWSSLFVVGAVLGTVGCLSSIPGLYPLEAYSMPSHPTQRDS